MGRIVAVGVAPSTRNLAPFVVLTSARMGLWFTTEQVQAENVLAQDGSIIDAWIKCSDATTGCPCLKDVRIIVCNLPI